MPVTVGQMVIAVATVLAILGVVFEVGRRLGQSKEQRDKTETSVDELETKLDAKFDNLERKIDHESSVREREHEVLLDWLGSLTDVLKEEGYDVKRPPEVTEGIDFGNKHDVDQSND